MNAWEDGWVDGVEGWGGRWTRDELVATQNLNKNKVLASLQTCKDQVQRCELKSKSVDGQVDGKISLQMPKNLLLHMRHCTDFPFPPQQKRPCMYACMEELPRQNECDKSCLTSGVDHELVSSSDLLDVRLFFVAFSLSVGVASSPAAVSWSRFTPRTGDFS